MSPEIRITEVQPGSIDSRKYLWDKESLDPGMVKVSKRTTTVTEITVPDVTGTYQTELGNITIDMRKIKKGEPGQSITIDSDLIDGKHSVDIWEQSGKGRIVLEGEKKVDITVHKARQRSSTRIGNPI